MRFLMLVVMPKDSPSEEGVMPDAELVGNMMKFNEELAKAGALIALDGLHPTSKGARVHFPGGKPVVSDGPFAEAKEVVGGYWIIKASSKEEAIEWAKKVPFGDDGVVEVRQIFDMEDFPADLQAAADSDIVKDAISA
jgi:hypothetical protein